MLEPLIPRIAIACCLVALGAGEAAARIKLVTLPTRERVEIQLDHPGATLIEEQRIVPLNRGRNQIDFSWAHAQVDPGSVVLRIETAGDGRAPAVEVLSASYPPGENALLWSVHAERAGPARVRISYLLGRLEKSYAYRAVAARDERTLELSQYARIRNVANEAFPVSGIWMGHGERVEKPLGNDETREILVARFADVAVRKRYSVDPAAFGYLNAGQRKLRVAMHYVLENRPERGLGRFALPAGKARIFQDDGQGSTAFLGEDWARDTPLRRELALYLGVARDVVVRRVVERNERQPIDGSLFHQHVVLRYEIENFKATALALDFDEDVTSLRDEVLGTRRSTIEWRIGDDTTFAGGLDARRTGATRVGVTAMLPPAAAGKARKVVHRLHITLRNEW